MTRNDLSPTLPLDGVWAFYSDADGNAGEIVVPGCWEAQGYPKTLDGPVIYRRAVHVPAEWTGQPIVAEFDAVSYAATVRCNGQVVGDHIGMWTPFAVDLSAALKPGQENLIEVEVVKPCHALTGGQYPLRSSLAGFLPDIATTFGGLWQSARLRVLAAGFDRVGIEADPTSGMLHVGARPVLPADSLDALVRITVAHAGQVVAAHETPVTGGEHLDANLRVTNPVLWQPGQPALYSVHLEMICGGRTVATVTERVGFRQLRPVGEQLLLNDRPISLRGVLSWGWNPATIAPCVTAESARREMRRMAALGFNLIKLCLFIPNQTYYEIADEEGMLLWQEWPMWLPDVTLSLRSQAPGEYANYIQLTRHHPSVLVYSLGCELDRSVDRDLLNQLDGVVRCAVTTAAPAKPTAAWLRISPILSIITPTAISTIWSPRSTTGGAIGSAHVRGSLANSAILMVIATALGSLQPMAARRHGGSPPKIPPAPGDQRCRRCSMQTSVWLPPNRVSANRSWCASPMPNR